jgi:hypothetical protein
MLYRRRSWTSVNSTNTFRTLKPKFDQTRRCLIPLAVRFRSGDSIGLDVSDYLSEHTGQRKGRGETFFSNLYTTISRANALAALAFLFSLCDVGFLSHKLRHSVIQIFPRHRLKSGDREMKFRLPGHSHHEMRQRLKCLATIHRRCGARLENRRQS